MGKNTRTSRVLVVLVIPIVLAIVFVRTIWYRIHDFWDLLFGNDGLDE